MAEQFYSNASQAGADQHSLSVGSIIHWLGTGVSVALLAGGVYWAFSIVSRDVTQIPVVSAQITPCAKRLKIQAAKRRKIRV